MNLFLALDLTPGEQEPMDDERIEIQWFSKTQLADLIRAGKVLDGKTIIGYFLWLEYKRRAGNRLFAR
jgi:ADP-ribose pyrophosphatase